MNIDNIFYKISDAFSDEIFQTLLETETIKIERILSSRQSTPPDRWYDQEHNEWVILLKGRARLLLEGDSNPIELHPGDYLNIPAHQRHRVEWTDPNQVTIWLAVHYK